MSTLTELPPWLRQIAIGLALFLIGGAISFGYSYRPLHGAKNWQIEQLETRLDEVNRENLALADQLASLRRADAGRIDPEALEQVEKELEKTRVALARAEKEMKSLDQKRREADSGATRWRKRYEDLRDSQAALAAAGPSPASPQISSDRPDPPKAPPPPGRTSPGLASTGSRHEGAIGPGALPSPRVPGDARETMPPASPSAPTIGDSGAPRPRDASPLP
jgi:hypothetical protein